jgi:hypothetical protein
MKIRNKHSLCSSVANLREIEMDRKNEDNLLVNQSNGRIILEEDGARQGS